MSCLYFSKGPLQMASTTQKGRLVLLADCAHGVGPALLDAFYTSHCRGAHPPPRERSRSDACSHAPIHRRHPSGVYRMDELESLANPTNPKSPDVRLSRAG